MGTTWHVVAIARVDASDVKPNAVRLNKPALQTAVEQELVRINALMSTWQADSALSLFNAIESTEPQRLAPEIIHLLRVAQTISEQTNGAYDVTRGNVFSLWGFGADNAAGHMAPAASTIEQALATSGFRQLQIHADTVSKASPSLSVDLSSIAKGYAVDQVGTVLEEAGIFDYLVEIGGEIRTRGRALSGGRWRIGVESPSDASKPERGIVVGDAHMASSGDYRNVNEIEGRRISHIMDGRTGQPVTHNLAAVTVLHESTALADAWATAFLVLGFEAAWEIASRDALAASFALRGADGVEIRSTPQWLFGQEKRPQHH